MKGLSAESVVKFNNKVNSLFTGGPPERAYAGGSEQALNEQRATLGGYGQQGAQQGQQMTAGGYGLLGQAGQYADQDRNTAMGLYNQGLGLGQSAMAQQNAALGGMLAQAGTNTASLAEMQMRQAQDQQARQLGAMAASARGGNQAAAMRMAAATGSQNFLATNQQAGLLRAQEENARVARMMGAQQAAAQAYGQQSAMGFGMANQGLGATLQSTGQLGQTGAQMGNLGATQQNIGMGYYGLLNDLNKTQLEADRGYYAAESMANNPAATFGSIVGGIAAIKSGGAVGGGGR